MLALTESHEKFNYSKLHLSNNTIERKWEVHFLREGICNICKFTNNLGLKNVRTVYTGQAYKNRPT